MKQKSHIRPIVYVMISVFLIIGYAYLTSSLTINGASLLKKATWDVHFENVQVADGSVTGAQVIQEPTIDDNETSVSFHVNLKLPGEFYEFTIDAVNAGTIDAMIDTYTDLELTEDQQKYLETSITYEDGEEVLEHQQLLAGDTAVYKVRVAYKLDLEAEDLPDNPEQLDLNFSVDFIQRDESLAIRRRGENNLYNVLKNSVNDGLALRYTGAHQDSMNSSSSNKDIYYWYAKSTSTLNTVKEKSNVIFADHCWQMYRTTDTGGVKLLYNGEADNGKCLSTRGTHVGYSGSTTQTLSTTYYYGTSYIYDNSNNVFLLDGTITTGTINIGNYTCKSTNIDGTCSTLYLVDSLSSGTSYYVFILKGDSHYSQFGTLQYNVNYRSPSYVGYMYGDVYNSSYVNTPKSQTFTKTKETLINNSFFGNDYWYANSIDYGNITPNRYTLIDAYQVNDSNDYPNLVGAYTFTSSNINFMARTAYYIVGVSGSKMYYLILNDGKLLSDYEPIVLGENIIENGNGTYTLQNTNSISLIDWFSNNENYSNKYICDNYSFTCEHPRYITSNNEYSYTYMDATEKILIAKERNGLVLSSTLLVRSASIATSPSDYDEYKYTCNSTGNVCTESTLRLITSFNASGYSYVENRYFGSSVEWDGVNYTLKNTIDIENYNNSENLSSHHYFCISPGTKVCQTVAYFYLYRNSSEMHYIPLNNGITSGSKALDDMLKKNTNSSVIKKGIEAWYKRYMEL